jgi:hypothetical protein
MYLRLHSPLQKKVQSKEIGQQEVCNDGHSRLIFVPLLFLSKSKGLPKISWHTLSSIAVNHLQSRAAFNSHSSTFSYNLTILTCLLLLSHYHDASNSKSII